MLSLHDLKPEQQAFLMALDATGAPTAVADPALANWNSYTARQKLRHKGLITFNKRVGQWQLTPAGVRLRGKADWNAWG